MAVTLTGMPSADVVVTAAQGLPVGELFKTKVKKSKTGGEDETYQVAQAHAYPWRLEYCPIYQ